MKNFSESSFAFPRTAFIFISVIIKKKCCTNLFSVSFCFIGLMTAEKMVVFFFSITSRLGSSKVGMTKSNNDLSHFASKL